MGQILGQHLVNVWVSFHFPSGTSLPKRILSPSSILHHILNLQYCNLQIIELQIVCHVLIGQNKQKLFCCPRPPDPHIFFNNILIMSFFYYLHFRLENLKMKKNPPFFTNPPARSLLGWRCGGQPKICFCFCSE